MPRDVQLASSQTSLHLNPLKAAMLTAFQVSMSRSPVLPGITFGQFPGSQFLGLVQVFGAHSFRSTVSVSVCRLYGGALVQRFSAAFGHLGDRLAGCRGRIRQRGGGSALVGEGAEGKMGRLPMSLSLFHLLVPTGLRFISIYPQCCHC